VDGTRRVDVSVERRCWHVPRLETGQMYWGSSMNAAPVNCCHAFSIYQISPALWRQPASVKCAWQLCRLSRSASCGGQSLLHRWPRVWNALASHIKLTSSHTSLYKHLKTVVFGFTVTGVIVHDAAEPYKLSWWWWWTLLSVLRTY